MRCKKFDIVIPAVDDIPAIYHDVFNELRNLRLLDTAYVVGPIRPVFQYSDFIKYIYVPPNRLSAAMQRNLGLNKSILNIESQAVVLLDDDMDVASGSILALVQSLYERADVVAAIPSLVLTKGPGVRTVKRLRKLFQPGSVSSCGWQVPYVNGGPKENRVEWASCCCIAIKKSILMEITDDNCIRFPPFKKGSYLEDVCFTRALGKKGKIVLESEILVTTRSWEKSNFSFGYEEVLNRYYLVRSSEYFSRAYFYIFVGLRCTKSLILFAKSFDKRFLSRCFGNFKAIYNIFFHNDLLELEFLYDDSALNR